MRIKPLTLYVCGSTVVGTMILLIGYVWLSTTNSSNMKTGHDDVNVLAGLLIVTGVILLSLTAVAYIVDVITNRRVR